MFTKEALTKQIKTISPMKLPYREDQLSSEAFVCWDGAKKACLCKNLTLAKVHIAVGHSGKKKKNFPNFLFYIFVLLHCFTAKSFKCLIVFLHIQH